LLYAVLAGLRTVNDFDLGWQLATGRWIVEDRQIVSTDVFSFTAAGKPWIYPVGSSLLFYLVFLMGGYAALSWLGVAACTGTVAIVLRRGSAAGAAIAADKILADGNLGWGQNRRLVEEFLDTNPDVKLTKS
jgi:hypothetical protein